MTAFRVENERTTEMDTEPRIERKPASYWVKRTRDGRTGWTGPIHSERQAQREADAWETCMGWSATVLPNSAAVQAAVGAWEKAKAGR